MLSKSLKEDIKVFIDEVVIPFAISVVLFVSFYFFLVLLTGTTTPLRIVAIDMPIWYQNSMYPTFITGDIIIVQKVNPSDLRVGDVIVFNRPYSDTPVVHRIIQIVNEGNSLEFKVKGDFNPIPDFYLVKESDILGKWTGYKIQLVGIVILLAQTTLGKIVLISLFVLYIVYTFLAEKKEKDEKKKIEANPVSSKDELEC
ncbi:signal peptidase I [archaeon]|jgi:signal peptidase|nr:signal peptidase I [archaeon]NHV06362.1 signal peptidase I [Nitrososphaerota archaeon]